MDRHPANADQHVLAAFIAEGHLDRHIRRIRGVYADIHRQIIEAVNKLIPHNLAWLEPSDQGMHLVLWLKDGIDDKWVALKASEDQVSIRAVSTMYAGGNGRPGVILGLGGFSPEEIESATRRLAYIITLAAQNPAE
ncbi:hypothetical protein D3C84_896640 [compost metagenome]